MGRGGLHSLVLCWRRLQQCTGTLLEAVTQVFACTLPQRSWILCVSTFAKADSLADLGKGVRLRNHMNESFAGAGLVVTQN